MLANDTKGKAHNLIDLIFKEFLPAQGMPERPAQIELSHQILNAMLDRKTALCEAGTGCGKTHSYLAAGMAFSLYRKDMGSLSLPTTISTSSIPLQKAILEDYLPFLSRVLLENGRIDKPIQAIIRKGKAHYVCDARLNKRLRKVDWKRKNPTAASALRSLRSCLDMDEVSHLSDYDRKQVCVPSTCDCGRDSCRYRHFLNQCVEAQYQFQICNHNLLLASAIHQSLGRRTILQEYPALIIDEAHKIPDASSQMFGMTLRASDFQTVTERLSAEKFLLAAETLTLASSQLRRKMAMPWDAARTVNSFLKLLPAPYRCLQTIQQQLGQELTPMAKRKLDSLATSVALFCDGNQDMIFYTRPDEDGGTMLCASASNLASQLRDTLWEQPCGIVLTSATLAVGNSFRRYKETAGLKDEETIREFVFPSPFDYKNKCLLYLPIVPLRNQSQDYTRKLADEIVSLLRAVHGHALILFTSYADMSAVKEHLEGRVHYPLFTMSRSAAHTAERFKAAPGGVLLAAGPAWEGFDFPGDLVSLLVIPRLPFAYPDALKEREKEGYPSLRDFIRAVAVPEMQIKLKQGIGRAIRTEADTCVIAILDERAFPGQRYFSDIMEVLPAMRITRSLPDVEAFIRRVKSGDYFLEVSA